MSTHTHTHTHAPVLSNAGVCSSSIDSSAAERMPGVVCCVFADDIPGSNATGPVEYDETVFARRQVCFCLSGQSGDPAQSAVWVDDVSFAPAGDVCGSYNRRGGS